MLYAYFNHQGTLLSLASARSDFPNAHEFEVATGTDANSIYLDTDTMTVEPKEAFAVRVSMNLISGLPRGTAVMFADQRFIVDDDQVEFDADIAEDLLVYLDHPRFIPQYIQVPTGPEEP